MSWKGNVFCNFLQTFVPGNTLKLNPADSFRLVKESAVISDIPALSSQIAAAQQYIMNGKSQHKNISAEHPRYIYARAATMIRWIVQSKPGCLTLTFAREGLLSKNLYFQHLLKT